MKSRDTAEEANGVKTGHLPVPSPSGYEAQIRSRLDGPAGERPQEETGRRTNQYRVDWSDRQIATAVHGGTMYVANHFQVAAYDLTSGQRLWQSQPPPGAMQRAQEWALIPMRPLVVGDRIFVRLLYSPHPVLACIERSSGKLLWVSENRDREFFVSDPYLVHGQLVALGILLQQDQEQLRHYHIDPRTGEILRHHDLVKLRTTWKARSCCELIEVEEGLVAVLGGFTIAIDTAVNIRWIRTQVALPADEDPRWVLQSYQRPLVRDGRIYLTQPGVRTVDCLDAATGRLYWSAILPEIVGLIGLAGDLLIVRTETEIRGLAIADSAAKWRYSANHLYSFPLVDHERLLIAGREPAPSPSDPSRIRLTWLNSADGQPTATTLLPSLEDSDPRLGPLVPFKDRLFTFFGRGQHDPTRDVVELIPTREAESTQAQDNSWQR
jgi:outer membrane protein assembly factor BamB